MVDILVSSHFETLAVQITQKQRFTLLFLSKNLSHDVKDVFKLATSCIPQPLHF